MIVPRLLLARVAGVVRLLIHKLAPLPGDVLNNLAALSSSQLTALSEALLDFTALGDLPGFCPWQSPTGSRETDAGASQPLMCDDYHWPQCR